MKVVRVSARNTASGLLGLLVGATLLTCLPFAASLGQTTPPAKPQTGSDLLAPPVEKAGHGMLYPALSSDGKKLCFTYLGDLWTVPVTGGVASRLTVHEALDQMPRWSPDGRWIAFTSLRNGNQDIFLIPSDGGEARQVTSYAGPDLVTDWTADGTKLLFTSGRETKNVSQFTIDLKTLAIKCVATDEDEPLRGGELSPDNHQIAVYRSGQPWWRPWYRGSDTAAIVVKDLTTQIVHPVLKTNTQQFWPFFSADGKSVYMTTIYGDSNTPNIWRVPVQGGEPKPITRYTTDAVRYPSISRDGAHITYTYNGDLYVVRADGSDAKKVNILFRTDDKINQQERQVLTQGAEGTQLSPDGKQIALILKGNIWLIPNTGGDAKRLTDSEGDYEDIAWSPDNSKIVLISDRGGQTDLYTLDVKTKALTRMTNDPDAESDTQWSPDGKYISYFKAGTQPGIYVLPAAGGTARRVAEGNGNNLITGSTRYAWSADNRWIVFTRMDAGNGYDVWVTPVAGGAAVNVTRYPGNYTEPQFTPDGQNLLFLGQRGAQPPQLFLLPLQSPDNAPADDAAKKPQPARGSEVKIDFEEIAQRVTPVAASTGVDSFAPMADSQNVVAHLGGTYAVLPIHGGGVRPLNAIPDAGGDIHFTPDGGRIYYTGSGGVPHTLSLAPIPPQPPATINFSAEYLFDRRQLYRQAFDEFYRKFGANFYDAKMHGVNWPALRDKYALLLPSVGTPEEFASLLSEMVGEVNSSHSEISPNSKGGGPTQSYLGVTFDMDYAGPGLKVATVLPKSPGDKLATRLHPGDYILKIDGADVSLHENYYKTLQNKDGKTLELTVNSKPTADGAHSVKFKSLNGGEMRNLEYEAMVRLNRERTEKLSGGRLAYLHIEGMDQPSLARFDRELWSETTDKDGLVLDIRGNGGGNTHDAILKALEQKIYGMTQPRDGLIQTQPFRAFTKPIILLINQHSYSDAEIFPEGFRALHLGKIVGVPTPGYVIGTLSPTLIDGTHFRIPAFGWYTVDGKNMENLGIPPDIFVENSPEDVAQHHDRQLEVAVSTLLKELPTSSGTEAPQGHGVFSSANDNPNGASSAVKPKGP